MKLLGEVTARDVKRQTKRLTEVLGRVLPQDIGKRYYDVGGGIVQIENDEQLRKRLGRKNPRRVVGRSPRRPRYHHKRRQALSRGDGSRVYRGQRRRRRNPTLGILAANPRGPHIVKELSRRTYDVAYKHTEDGGPYKHSFGKGVHISLLSDGNVLLWHPTHSIWKRFA